MAAILERFKVLKFRSVQDSGWIDANKLTALIGTNEAGKTNLLLPLWKLRPANDEAIDPLIDYPRNKYSKFKSEGDKDPFIIADFRLSSGQKKALQSFFDLDESVFDIIQFSRYWDGKYRAVIQNIKDEKVSPAEISNFFERRLKLIQPLADFKGSSELKTKFESLVSSSKKWKVSDVTSNIKSALTDLKSVEIEPDEKQKELIDKCLLQIERLEDIYTKRGSAHNDSFKAVFKYLPSFVYYSDYGNLNSEIYLPRVIEDLERTDLRGIERDKARTLKVLFDFVQLTPKQILELGIEEDDSSAKTDETIQIEAKKKKEREVLLQSASTEMTREFKDWWKQGNYRFRFQADGNHFRIWVSDDVRPEEIELESRSRGLQWFFSFFLVFLVESHDEHSGCILLLDEPGVTLHPSAQEDLIRFFHSLSDDNQVLYTTHSPFLIDSSNLGSVLAVYVDESGFSCVSSDLRRGSKVLDKSVYPAHAAIGLTVSETFLHGCLPVLVEGVSDQVYLHVIKNILIKMGVIQPERELVFIPTGGVKGMKPIINIIMGRDNILPIVVLDGDSAGKTMIKSLHNGLYKDEQNKVIDISSLVKLENAEIEDLIPVDIINKSVDKLFRGRDDFEDGYRNNEPIVPQIEEFIKAEALEAEIGWKVQLAKKIARKLPEDTIQKKTTDLWLKLFQQILTLSTS